MAGSDHAVEVERTPDNDTLRRALAPEQQAGAAATAAGATPATAATRAVSRSPAATSLGARQVRAKSVVGAVTDPAERAADRAADKVLRMAAPEENRPTAVDPTVADASSRGPGSATSIPVEIQRSPANPGPAPVPLTESASGATALASPIRRQAVADHDPHPERAVPAETEHYLDKSRGTGSALPDGTRSYFESRFSTDFRAVRVHDENAADQAAKSIGALAFTRGRDIWFSAGTYDTVTDNGRGLLAHELAHVAQQNPGIGRQVDERPRPVTQAAAPAQALPQAAAPAQAPAQAAVPAQVPAQAAAPAAGGAESPPHPVPGSPAVRPGSARQPAGLSAATEAPGAERAPVAQAGAPAGGVAAGRRHTRSPHDDPGFRATVARVSKVAAHQRGHGSAHGAAVAAQAAAPGPPGEVRASAEAQQVARIDEQHPKEFDSASFASLLRSRVDAKAPRNPQEARDFPTSGKLGELKTEMTGAARASAANAGSDVRGQAQAAPDQSGIAPKPVTPLPEAAAAPVPGDLGAAQAAPKPLPAADVSAGVNAQQQQLDSTMTKAGVTDDQLASSNEPTFTKTLTEKQAAGQMAATMPAQYRAAESATIATSQAQAVGVTQQQTAAMRGDRAALLGQVTGQQHATMAADEASRAKVAADLEQIYEKTRTAVEARLDKLDKDVGATFDAALADARQAFESYIETELDKRYSHVTVWIEDKLLTWGLPPAVQAIFDAGRARFISFMDAAIDRVSELVASGLNEAKQKSADGRKEVSEKVAQLDPALRDVGREAAQSIGAKFDDLDQTITAKRDQLVDSLAGKYQEGLKQLDDRITELESEHAGLIAKAVSSVTGVISTILEMKNLLLQVLAKAIDTIDVIIAHPIRFLGNLVAAVGQGVRSFVDNIVTHLKEGFFEWLFGEFASAGITLPKTWDLKGIFGLIMQILGLTWTNIRKIAVEVVGEPIVRTLETVAEPIIVLIREGPAGLWNWIKDQLSNLKAMVVDEIQSWVITNVIKAGVTWLIGLLNPASAFIKACKAIYDILEFIWTRGKQILEFVSAVVDSVAEIAAGSLGKAAQKVEGALAKAIPVTIGFLAGLLGLGDISETIKKIIEKIQAPVHAAVKWLITKAVGLVKAAGKLLGFGKKDEEKGPHSDDPEKDAKIATALAELDERDAAADTGEGIEREQAETIAATTQANHPVLTSIKIVETPQRFDYAWTSSPARLKTGPNKKNKEEGGGPYSDIKDGTLVEPGRRFTLTQKRKILQANRERNGGQLRSDDPSDPYQELSDPVQSRSYGMGGQPQDPAMAAVDHILPRVDGGSNSYGNARVISQYYNQPWRRGL